MQTLPDWSLSTLGRWFIDEPAARIVEAAVQWQPYWPAIVLVGILVVLWCGAVLAYRKEGSDLGRRWRIGLGLLRLAVLTVPVIILLQPALHVVVEKYQPQHVAILLDRSASMSVRDGSEAQPTSRWERACDALQRVRDRLTASSTGTISAAPPELSIYLFNDRTQRLTGPAQAQNPPQQGERPQQPSREQGNAAPLLTASSYTAEGTTAIAAALHQARQDLAGANAARIILLSDGADTVSSADQSPLQAARELAQAGIPVSTCLIGGEHLRNIQVEALAETPFAFAGDPVPLRVRVTHQHLAATPISVQVTCDDQPLASRELTLPPEGQISEEVFDIRLDAPGRNRCRIDIAPVTGEITTTDNRAVVDVEILDEPIRVLYIEHWPRWQYRFLRNAFQRDRRFDARLVLLTADPARLGEDPQTAGFPQTPEALWDFDAIILGDLSRQDLTPEQWEWIRDHVIENGAGLILAAGTMHMPADFLDSPLAPLLPFERVATVVEEDAEPFRPELTPLGSRHPLMRFAFNDPERAWAQLPTLQWLAGISELKPGAVPLAQRPAGPGGEATPMIVLSRAGRGLVLFVGTDESWKWRYQTGNRYFYGFWSQALQHVGMPHRVREFRPVRIELASPTLMPGVPTPVSVALDAPIAAAGAPGGETITLLAQPRGGAAPFSFTLQRSADSPLLYHGRVQFDTPDHYTLLVEGQEGRGQAAVEVLSAAGLDPELSDPRVNETLMRQIADLTGGQFIHSADLPNLLDRLDAAPLRHRWSQTMPLWDGWGLLTVLAALLAAEWGIRKWKYLP